MFTIVTPFTTSSEESTTSVDTEWTPPAHDKWTENSTLSIFEDYYPDWSDPVEIGMLLIIGVIETPGNMLIILVQVKNTAKKKKTPPTILW